jgi:CBS domain-containing protein
MKVSEVMNKAIAISPEISVLDAAKMLSDKNIGSLIVIEDNKILGIITENDIVKNVSNLAKSVEQIMSKNLVTVSEDETLNQAAKLMRKHRIKRIPVIKDKALVGIITATDLIANVDEIDEDFLIG